MRIAIIAVASALAFSAPLLADDAPASKDVVATQDYVVLKVGTDSIKKSEIENTLKSLFPGETPPDFDKFDANIKENLLRGVASEHVLLQDAKKSGIQNSEDVKERIETASNQVIIQAFLKQKTQDAVTDDKLKVAYDQAVHAQGDNKEEIHARHILVKTEADAKAIEKRLKKGEDFAKLANEKSEDKASGASGGDLGWFTADKMTPEFSKAAFALKKGEISAPVKTDFGWHVIQVEDRRKVEPPSLDQMKPALRQEVGNKAVREYVDGIMKNVKITMVDPAGKETDISSPAIVPTAAPAATPTATPKP